MSLSGWFKEYLYIPLGGNRRGPLQDSDQQDDRISVLPVSGTGQPLTSCSGVFITAFSLCWKSMYQLIGKKGGKVKALFPAYICSAGSVHRICVFQGRNYGTGMFSGLSKCLQDFRWKASAMSLALQQLTPVYLVTLAVCAYCS